MIRRIGIISVLAFVMAFAFLSPSQAQNAHFVRAGAAGPDAAGNLVVSFKIAGLGDNQTITVTTSGNATAVYACQNNGGNFPSDPKKTAVSGPVSATGDFTSGKNGTVSNSLTLMPPPNTALTCPGGQHVVLVSVSYSNVQVSSPGIGTVSLGTFSRTFFNI